MVRHLDLRAQASVLDASPAQRTPAAFGEDPGPRQAEGLAFSGGDHGYQVLPLGTVFHLRGKDVKVQGMASQTPLPAPERLFVKIRDEDIPIFPRIINYGLYSFEK